MSATPQSRLVYSNVDRSMTNQRTRICGLDKGNIILFYIVLGSSYDGPTGGVSWTDSGTRCQKDA
jgi:hypothetical protein